MIGWIGSLMLAFCAFPQAFTCYKQGHAKGLDASMLILWTLGEFFTLYAVTKDAPISYLLYNYAFNILFLTIIWRFKIFPRK